MSEPSTSSPSTVLRPAMVLRPAYKTITQCRLCGATELIPLFSLGEQYVSDFLKKPTAETPDLLQVPIELVLCTKCTLAQQLHTAPPELLYRKNYWYRSSVTATMRAALADVAASATRVAGLSPGDVVLDLGSNDGTLLRSYQVEDLVTVGVEPADNFKVSGAAGIFTFLPEFWGADEALKAYYRKVRKQAKVITACGMLYDLNNPNSFVAQVVEVLAPDGIFIAQLMCARQMLEAGDVGNLAHEHLEFYTLKSLEKLFNAHGLDLFDVEKNDVNGGSYRLYSRFLGQHVWHTDAKKRLLAARDEEEEMGLSSAKPYQRFYDLATLNAVRCVDFIHNEVDAGSRIFVYGASTKGNVLLQWYGLDSDLIEGAADRSPEKWGRYTVGTDIRIVSEEYARLRNPAYFLCLPYSFLPEFLAREAKWREGGGKFIVPLPSFKVV